jgi:hypothetical protein
MSLFGDGLDAAVQKSFTRPAPKSAPAQVRRCSPHPQGWSRHGQQADRGRVLLLAPAGDGLHITTMGANEPSPT